MTLLVIPAVSTVFIYVYRTIVKQLLYAEYRASKTSISSYWSRIPDRCAFCADGVRGPAFDRRARERAAVDANRNRSADGTLADRGEPVRSACILLDRITQLATAHEAVVC